MKRRASGRAIPIILGCFQASGLIRLGIDGPAIAKEMVRFTAQKTPNPQEELEEACEPAEDPDALLLAIRSREDELAEQEVYLASRAKELEIVEDRLRTQLALLRTTEERLNQTIALADQAAERDLNQLTVVYEKMKPAAAAEVFETMDVSFAAGFLGRMKPEAAAAILAEMTPEFAYSASVIIAGRNTNAPEN